MPKFSWKASLSLACLCSMTTVDGLSPAFLFLGTPLRRGQGTLPPKATAKGFGRGVAASGGFKMTGAGPILVTGASGRTGRLVIKQLLERGESVRALVRDDEGAAKLQSTGAAVVRGDVCKYDELLAAIKGCRACVVCHGSERPTKPIKDMAFKIWDPDSVFLGAWGPSRPEVVPADWGEDYSWLDPGTEDNHPWNTYYLSACNMVDAAEEAGCGHVVVVSDAECAYDPTDPRAIISNLQNSFALKWRYEGEMVYRNATFQGTAYTILRASKLTDDEGPPEGMQIGDVEARGRSLGRGALADACVGALYDPLALNATVAVSWGPAGASHALFVGQDEHPLYRKRFSLVVVGMFVTAALATVAVIYESKIISAEMADRAVWWQIRIAVPIFFWWSLYREKKYYPGQEPQPEEDQNYSLDLSIKNGERRRKDRAE